MEKSQATREKMLGMAFARRTAIAAESVFFALLGSGEPKRREKFMTVLKKTACLAVGLLVLTAAVAEAQELRGRITGVVRDNTGGVLPGVTVTASGPALIQPQTTVTGEDGSYRFPALPTGVYTVQFELAGFQTLRREEIRVGLNVTLTIDAQLQLAAVQEVLTITGESPVVDVKSTTTGTSFTKELLQDIPNARDIWAALSQAPGFQMTGYDVGGSHTGTQTGYQTYGYGDQNKTLLEGINVTESRSANAGYFDFGSFEEFQVGGAGNMGEQTGLGALINITIKSGGDEFHGDVYYDYRNDSTISDNVPDEFKAPSGTLGDFRAPASGLERGNPITKQYDFNVGVGGPIVKGKAWFYAGYENHNQFKVILGLPDEAESKLVNYTVKGTYQINSKNQFIGYFNQRTKLQPLRNLSLAVPVESAWYQASKNRPWKLEWTSVPNDRIFLDLQFSQWGNFFPLFPAATKSTSVEGVAPARVDLTTSQWSGSYSYYHDRTTLKPQFSGTMSYFKDNWGGTHNFKVGFEGQRERRKFLRFLAAGELVYRDRAGVPAEVEIWNTPNEGINDTSSVGVYAQDAWTIANRLTLNLGFRFDHYSLGWPEQSISPNRTDIFQPLTTPDTHIISYNSVSPRLGFAYDLTGSGKTVLKAYFGRFYFNPSTDIGTPENPVGAAGLRYIFNDLNGNKILDGPQELGRLLTTRGGAGFVRIDREMDHPYGQEFSAHVEHELMENFSLRASYVHKAARDDWAEVDIARVNAYTIPFVFNDTGPDNVRGTADDQVINLFDRPAATPSDRVMTTPGRFTDPNNGDYDTFEFGIHKRFAKNWLLMTSFEHTWAEDYRATTSSTSALGVARMGQSFLWRPNQRRFGRQKTTYWNYKLVGRYVFPHGIGVSASYKLQSGYNIAREISVALPGAGSEVILADRLENDRAPNVGILDFRVEKSFNLGGRKGTITPMLDVFNATNSDTIVNFRLRSGSRYNEVIALLDPRIFRFGIRYSF
jgi:outer membrane receptor protein involved in Fe transport